jgi:signal transduction histidine kinase/CHASE3 domain sensor protein
MRVRARRGRVPRGDQAARRPRRSGGLTRRVIAASTLLALCIAAGFVVLLLGISDLRDAERRENHSLEVLVAANGLERVLLDIETGQRGYVLTRDQQFLGPWRAARQSFPGRARALLALVEGDPAQVSLARRIAQAERGYLTDYSAPLVAAARRGDPSARSVPATLDGERRIGAMRADFDRLMDAEHQAATRSQASVTSDARRALAAALIALAASIALIALYAGYLTRALVRPVGRTARMAGLLAGGDLAARMPETGVGEIGGLERAFNVMGSSLERSRHELAGVAAEQAALRRVATLVARGAAPEDVLATVADEIARVVDAEIATVLRYDVDGAATVVGAVGVELPFRSRLTVTGDGLSDSVLSTGASARSDQLDGPPGSVAARLRQAGARSAVGCPIIVDGRQWGVVIAATARPEPLPAPTEARVQAFTELIATAVSNLRARAELRRVAKEQAALRRVATLVAQTAEPAEIFVTVTREVGELCRADLARMERYEADGTVTGVAAWSREGVSELAVGTRFELDGASIAALVNERRAPARLDTFEGTSGGIAQEARALGIRSSVGCPIVVDGRVWGVFAASSTSDEAFPPETESQIGEFTELVATAIANAEAQGELSASRARVVATADETRRKIERDLHDGAQQRLVSLALQVRAAQADVPLDRGGLAADLERVATGLNGALEELREFARGIHPAILAERGLAPALRTLSRRSPVAVDLDVHLEGRMPEAVEVGAYYVVSEALANAAKHAHASRITVAVGVLGEDATGRVLNVSVRDDGVGGASFARGSGLVGLRDRVQALGGRIALQSDPGAGTTLSVALPLRGDAAVSVHQ